MGGASEIKQTSLFYFSQFALSLHRSIGTLIVAEWGLRLGMFWF
jgi:hypothetical protein